jgi:hypothetical protein
MVTSLKPFASVEGIAICSEGIAIAVPQAVATIKHTAANTLPSFIFPLLFIVDFEQ